MSSECTFQQSKLRGSRRGVVQFAMRPWREMQWVSLEGRREASTVIVLHRGWWKSTLREVQREFSKIWSACIVCVCERVMRQSQIIKKKKWMSSALWHDFLFRMQALRCSFLKFMCVWLERENAAIRFSAAKSMWTAKHYVIHGHFSPRAFISK